MHPHCACPLLELARVYVRAARFGLRCKCHIIALMGRFGLSASRAPAPKTKNPVRPVVTSSSKKPTASSSAIPGSTCDVKTTPALQNLLDSWGRELVNKVMACYDAWKGCGDVGASSGASCALDSNRKLRVGTDCSGAEAPIWALRAMGIKHVHKFSCDWEKPVRDFIAAVSPPRRPHLHGHVETQEG